MDEDFDPQHEPATGASPRVLPAVAIGAVALLGVAAAVRLLRRKPEPVDLSACVVQRCTELLPRPDTIFGEPDPRWDAAMGGRRGADVWGYYQENAGTTCGLFAAWILSLCGAPAAMINRAAPEGSGFTVGAHITKIYQGARSLGWLRTPPASGELDLRPGDLYCTTRAGATYHGQPVSGEHVGFILSIGPAGPDGARAVETADGGQTDGNGRQCAKRRQRTLRGRQLSLVTGPATIDWWVRLGG